jgi:hypothetical protein
MTFSKIVTAEPSWINTILVVKALKSCYKRRNWPAHPVDRHDMIMVQQAIYRDGPMVTLFCSRSGGGIEIPSGIKFVKFLVSLDAKVVIEPLMSWLAALGLCCVKGEEYLRCSEEHYCNLILSLGSVPVRCYGIANILY